MPKLSVEEALSRANSHRLKGESAQAKALYKAVLAAFPKNEPARHALKMLDMAANDTGLNPPQAQLDSLVTLHAKGQSHAAALQADLLIKDFPNSFALWTLFANINFALGHLSKSEQGFRQAARLNPDYFPTYANLGVALYQQGKWHDAVAAYKHGLHLKPDDAEAYCNMGNALQNAGKLDEAVAAYKMALQFKPDYADPHNNMGAALQKQGKLGAAIESYTNALQLNPQLPAAYNNMGFALKDQGKLGEAIAAYQRALALNPDYADAYNNMGNAFKEQGKLDEAIAAYTKAFNLEPHKGGAQSQMLHQLQHICDFEQTAALEKLSARIGIETEPVPPFALLTWADNPEHQLARAQRWVLGKFNRTPLPLPARPAERPKRLKIGFFSADFHNHPVLYLMSGLMREFDKSLFEIFAFSYGRTKDGEMRRNVINDVEHFFDVSGWPDQELFDIARSTNLDIAIDLTGFTAQSRSGLFQARLAPIQINYLGFPGAMGANFMDYIIGDKILIPNAERAAYSEKIIYLPDTQCPTDNTREIPQLGTDRSDFSLPKDAIVFCAMHRSYKISPREFDIWMRLLKQVEGSVLWLLRSNRWAEENLRDAARLRGVNADRLVFARETSHAEYLARFRHADIFVDTFNHNAHTTACDALWAGLPIVTKQGRQFIARGASSLLHAVGLPELITKTAEDYEALIFDLALNREKLTAIKGKLAKNRLTYPLFDTARYTRAFEAGLRQAYDLYFAGQPPADIWIPDAMFSSSSTFSSS